MKYFYHLCETADLLLTHLPPELCKVIGKVVWKMDCACGDAIPVIDIADLWKEDKTEESRKISISIAEACRDYGFFYIKNHDVDEESLNNVIKVFKNFVARPQCEKEKIMSEGGTNFRGYFKFLSEISGYLKGLEPDWREGLYLAQEMPDDHPCKKRFPSITQHNKWPMEPVEFRNTVETYFNNIKEIGFKIMSSLALGLGLKKDFFEPLFTPYPMAQLGMFYYHGHSKHFGPNELSCGEHTDYGILTILLQDDVGGLEVYGNNGQWIQVPPLPGTFVVNLGDMLEVWSNGAYKANRHRVKKSESGSERVSMAFFCGPCPDSVIAPLPLEKPLITLQERKPNSDIKIPVMFGEFLAEKYQGTFGNKNKS